MIFCRVHNYKISVKLSDSVKEIKALRKGEKSFVTKKSSSFIVIRLKGYVYTAFNTGHVNITGVKNIPQLKHCLKVLKFEIFPGAKIRYFKIDNIVASGTLGVGINLKKFCQFLQPRRPEFRLHVNFQRFPGACINVREPKGTILLFSSGKFVLTGSDTIEKLGVNCSKLERVYHEYSGLLSPYEC